MIFSGQKQTLSQGSVKRMWLVVEDPSEVTRQVEARMSYVLVSPHELSSILVLPHFLQYEIPIITDV